MKAMSRTTSSRSKTKSTTTLKIETVIGAIQASYLTISYVDGCAHIGAYMPRSPVDFFAMSFDVLKARIRFHNGKKPLIQYIAFLEDLAEDAVKTRRSTLRRAFLKTHSVEPKAMHDLSWRTLPEAIEGGRGTRNLESYIHFLEARIAARLAKDFSSRGFGGLFWSIGEHIFSLSRD